MAHAGEHGGALLDMTLDAVAHLDEGLRRLPHFARAARAEIGWRRPAFAEAVGGFGQAQDRLDLVAQEQDGDGEQHERGAEHPQEEDLRIGGIGLAAPRQHMHHGVVELDANVDEVGGADGVDPERLADLPLDLVGQRAVEQIEERPRARLRQLVVGHDLDPEPEVVIGELDQRLDVLVLGIRFVDVDEHGDVLHRAGGETPRHRFPVALQEHEGDDRLEQHHRRDDDDERPGVESLRHPFARPASRNAHRPSALLRAGT